MRTELQMALDDLRVVQHAHSSDITAMAFSYELSQIVTGDRHGELRAWDFQDLKLVSATCCAGSAQLLALNASSHPLRA